MSLFSEQERENVDRAAPRAARMRPRTLAEFFGQKRITGDNAFLRRLINSDNVPSLLFFGPPGCGKTTLGHIIANSTRSHFEKLNAVAAGTADVKRLAEEAQRRLRDQNIKTIVFIDESHRFNKLQQDSLLPHVESGAITLIGATTENPYTEVNPPLLSRMRTIRLTALSEDDIISLMHDALTDSARGMGTWQIDITNDAEQLVALLAAGDARVALNVIEQAVFLAALREDKQISVEIVRELTGETRRGYDPDNNNRSDIVSAFIKSMRGSDPQAVAHYLARLISAGEDPEFIARRIVVAASEDVGNADPMALVVATNALLAIKNIGMPEARIILAQAAIYIACAPKSNAAYSAVDAALADVDSLPVYPIPVYLRNHYNPQLTAGKRQYKYPHASPGNWVEQHYLPDELTDKKYYLPTSNGYEQNIRQRLEKIFKPKE